MAIVLPHVGAEILLGKALNNVTKQSCKIKLFTAVTGDEARDRTKASFTDCEADGYAACALAKGSYSVTIGSGDDTTYISYEQQSFTFTGTGNSILGYYVTEDNDDEVLWAEEFAAAETVYSGKTIKITPKLELSTAS